MDIYQNELILKERTRYLNKMYIFQKHFSQKEEQSSHILVTVCGASLAMMEITSSGREASQQRFANKHTPA